MGYVVPPRQPSPMNGIITLPAGATYSAVESVRQAWEHPRLGVIAPHDFGIQWMSALRKPDDPRGWTERNVNALGYGLLASFGVLIAVIAWAVAT